MPRNPLPPETAGDGVLIALARLIRALHEASAGRADQLRYGPPDHPAPFAAGMARRYHEDSRASAGLDPVFRKLWGDGAKDRLPRAEAWLRKEVPAIAARLG